MLNERSVTWPPIE